MITEEIMYEIRESRGAHAVFLAAKHDSHLSGLFTTDIKGNLRYRGQRCTRKDLASILVYLQGQYRIQPSGFELESGLLAAAEGAPRRKREAKDPGPLVVSQIQGFLHEHGDSPVTSEEIGAAVFPDDFVEKRRSTEMMITSVLRGLGYQCVRTMVDCKRKYRWDLPADKPNGV